MYFSECKLFFMLWNDTDFQRAANSTKLSDRTIEACRDVLVNGLSGIEAGDKHNVVPAQISRALKTIRDQAINTSDFVKNMIDSTDAMKAYAISEAKVEFPALEVVDIKLDKTYSGPIVMKTPGYVVQRDGRTLVAHDIGKLERSPSMSNELHITYPKDGGKAAVVDVVKDLDKGVDDLGR